METRKTYRQRPKASKKEHFDEVMYFANSTDIYFYNPTYTSLQTPKTFQLNRLVLEQHFFSNFYPVCEDVDLVAESVANNI